VCLDVSAERDVPVSRVSTLRAPTQDGAIVAEPPLSEVASLLEQNRRRLQRAGLSFLGRDWNHLQTQAREEVVAAAHHYMIPFGEAPSSASSQSLLMAGHQPELFHPGVWVKNFLLFGLARKHGLTPLNLIVDNDAIKSTLIRVPCRGGSAGDKVHLVSVPFDRWTGETTWEWRGCADPELFASFPERVAELLRAWNYEPLLPAFWTDVRRRLRERPILGACFAAARRNLERHWGCHNLEVPVSAVCRTEAFAWFACHLLTDLPRFHTIYNEVVAAYRRAHGLRSRSHPVPDLGVKGAWLETPFWGSQAAQAQRGRLYARRTSSGIELRAGTQNWPSLPSIERDQTAAVHEWQRLEVGGFLVRSRALTNTLFARLFLADLFIHGIGGGKYDELTDEIMRRFYDIEPPQYLVFSATRLLPLPTAPVSVEDCDRLARAVRDVHYNPQRHLPDASSYQALIAEKQAWIERQPADKRERRERFEKLRELTEKLREPLLRREMEMRDELKSCEQLLETNAVLQRRDYAFVLYPEVMLREFCTQFL
jgi:hypothetical protein